MNLMTTFCAHVRRIHLLASVLLLAGLCGAQTAQAQARYSYSVDGTEVTDSKTGLVWQRCSAGQSWSAAKTTCTGTAATYTHEAALSFAKTQTGWRLPNVKELSSITVKTRSNPAIDVMAFPATPSSWFWTSTPSAFNASFAWGVNFKAGYVHYNSSDRNSPNFQVRLVR
ncbi:MAG: hypothetical protein FD135_5547 [Comamonadaceae bacterium]|nr:MAG: hypothetical protein FD135_5547 [Comamonadaceae bacterium]